MAIVCVVIALYLAGQGVYGLDGHAQGRSRGPGRASGNIRHSG